MVDVPPPSRVLLRVRMPDRPGALATVAGRIGAVRGDLVGIEILERSDGEAVDELLVELPSLDLLDLLVRELHEIEEVEVIEAVTVDGQTHDPQQAAFEVAAVLIGAENVDELLWSLCTHIRRTVRTDWVCVVDGFGNVLAQAGPTPSEAEVAAIVRPASEGLRAQPKVEAAMLGDAHVSWLPLPAASAALLLGRTAAPLRAAERHRAAALTRMAATWYSRLTEQSRLRSMLAHPSGGNQHMAAPTSVPDDLSGLVDQR